MKLRDSMLHKLGICLFAIPFFFFCISAEAKIEETDTISDILNEVDQNTLVFFDIDDTLITTESFLGSSPWWDYFVKKISSANFSDKWTPEIYSTIYKILCKVPMVLIEPGTEQMIEALQKKGIPTFALTARGKNENFHPEADLGTHQHLTSVGIDFTKTVLPIAIDPHTAQFFSYGVVFTRYQEKGPFLEIFIKNLDLHSSKIVFVDDKIEQLKSVEKAVEGMGIDFYGYRYGRLDAQHQQFNVLFANIQLEALVKHDQVLSNEDAMEKAEAQPHLHPEYFMDHLIQKWSTP